MEVVTPEYPYGTGEFVDYHDILVLDSLRRK
jgi:hypothetical protein